MAWVEVLGAHSATKRNSTREAHFMAASASGPRCGQALLIQAGGGDEYGVVFDTQPLRQVVGWGRGHVQSSAQLA